MRRRLALTGMMWASLAVAGGCSASDSAGLSTFGATPAVDEDASSAGSGGSSANGAPTGALVSSAEDAGLASLPNETKEEANYESPVATGDVVWTANPTNDEVAYIDATSFTVQTLQAGEGPTYVAAVPDPSDDVAIVQNVVSGDATLFRRDAQGNVSSTTFASTSDANSWAISSSGRWAIAWTNSSLESSSVAAQSFDDIAVMDLSTAVPDANGVSTPMAIGYRPSAVAFAGDSYAYVVTQQGIAQIDLQTQPPETSAQFPLTAPAPPDDASAATATDASAGLDASGDGGTTSAALEALPPEEQDGGTATAPDVSFTPDGSYALVREDGLSFITVISLTTGALTAVPLPSAPTDLDLSPDGEFAVAALRDISTVAVLPIPGVVTDPSAITLIPISDEVIGRAIITPDGKRVLLFTTVTSVAQAQDLTVLTLSNQKHRTVPLVEPILAVFPTSDSSYAVVLHNITPSAGVLGAYSLVPIAEPLPVQLESTPAAPTSVALSPSGDAGDRVVISLRDDPSQTYDLDLGLFPSLQVIRQTLASPPIAAGIVAGAGQGYAAQDYAEGRITFVQLYPPDGGTPGQALTITGFDLGARIVEGLEGSDE